GVRVHDAEVVEMLIGAGCKVEDTDLVRFPAAAVEEALDHAPSRIVLSDRMGEERLWLEGDNSYFGTGSDLPFTRDLETGERRPSLLEDVARAARLVDALPNVDFVMSMAQASDVPSEMSDRKSFLAMVENTTKPIVFTAWDEAGLADILAMAETVVGGADKLVERPFLLAYLEPTSPLQHLDFVLRKMLLLADRGLPFVYAPGPIDGASAPMTPAGSLVMANAEVLSGLVIAQLRRPGTPFLFGSGSGPLDMLTAVGTYSSPEFLLHCKAMAELAHRRYELPVWGFSGCTDSKLPDIQAGIDAALWILWTTMSGANLIHDLGYIESGLTCSLEMIVACDEIVSFVRRLMAGIEITPETLALEVIDEVGPGGDFLGTAHTLRHFRNVWSPQLFDRHNHAGWIEAGRPDFIGSARKIALEAVRDHQCEPLAADTIDSLRAIVAEADARAGIGV
ncbi:MAG: trimethylamine methyltransferase family protein, partial [Thermoanaerobaculia bacterium]